MTGRPPIRGGAYGLTIRGPETLVPWLSPALPDIPEVTVEASITPVGEPDHADGERALITLFDGRRLAADRASGSAVLHGPAPDPDELVHPLLGSVATVFSKWLGREVFHAGVVAVDGRALVLLGDNGAGKSTLLASAALRGHAVLADDLAVTDGDWVHAGPRQLDLRSEHGLREPFCRVRGDRLRITLGPAPHRLALGAWVLLEWGPTVELQPVPAAELLPILATRRALRRVASAPETFVALAARPAWRLRRPRDWSAADGALDLLLSAARGDGAGSR